MIQTKPHRCTHSYSMIFDDDFCCCTRCEQQWFLEPIEGGGGKWIPYVNGKPYVAPRGAQHQRSVRNGR